MKVTGFKCDVCPTMSDTPERPDNWLMLRLPNGGPDATKDLCSDKCLLYFAKQRVQPGIKPRQRTTMPRELTAFLDERGVAVNQRGPVMSNHVRARHEMGELDESCPVCEFITREGE